MYRVTALDSARGPTRFDHWVDWTSGQTRDVEDDVIGYYRENPTVFTVVDGPSLPTPGESFGYGLASYACIDFNGVMESAATITINSVIYLEADAAVPASGIFTNGASAADSAASFLTAVNGDTRATVPFTAVADVSGDSVWLFWDAVGANNVTITTDSSSNCTVMSAVGGAVASDVASINITATVTTQMLLSGSPVEIPLPFTPTGFHVSATDSAGTPIYFTDKVTIQATPARIRIDTDGGTNLANTDIVYLTAFK